MTTCELEKTLVEAELTVVLEELREQPIGRATNHNRADQTTDADRHRRYHEHGDHRHTHSEPLPSRCIHAAASAAAIGS